jgi:hypothetical protein
LQGSKLRPRQSAESDNTAHEGLTRS